jgi:hypothetical protein
LAHGVADIFAPVPEFDLALSIDLNLSVPFFDCRERSLHCSERFNKLTFIISRCLSI